MTHMTRSEWRDGYHAVKDRIARYRKPNGTIPQHPTLTPAIRALDSLERVGLEHGWLELDPTDNHPIETQEVAA